MNKFQKLEKKLLRTKSLSFKSRDRLQDNKSLKLLEFSTGLIEESNEVLTCIRKNIFSGKELDENNLKEELGDVLWYCCALMSELGTNMEEVMKIQKQKLKIRYPEKYTEKLSRNRDVKKEQIGIDSFVKKELNKKQQQHDYL
jgi:NTP pyrophosphatase (non-canonical NTP hydrolase)